MGRRDKCLLILGLACSVVAGALLPSISYIVGSVSSVFGGADISNIQTEMASLILPIVIIAVVIFLFTYLLFFTWQMVAENLLVRLRRKYIRNLFKQEAEYFDSLKLEELPTQVTEIFSTLEQAIGDKMANLLFSIFCCVGGICLAFARGASYAGCCFAYSPWFLIVLAVFGRKVK